MCDQINRILTRFDGNEPASKESLDSVEREIGWRLPEDYCRFMTRWNGGEGFLGKQYLILWRAEEIAPFNRDYQVNEYAPGILLFASSGGGEAFGFDMRSDQAPVVQVPFVGLDLRYAKEVARNFTDLLLKMSESDGSLL
jgi:cell wall assembly regulator SMI1